MLTTGALLYGDHDRFLRFDPAEHPVALQLGGSDPVALAQAARMGEDYGYDEINLNCGCPSDRVQSGRFGACLMKEPEHVAECVAAMIKAVKIPVTVKSRIGVDAMDDFAFLDRFVGLIADAGCTKFIIHARKAWLSGLSPKQNREIPPLDYNRVRAIKEKYPHLHIILNGGLTTLEAIQSELPFIDGVMIGREAYHNPWFLRSLENEILNGQANITREQIAELMTDYAREQNALYGTPVKSITRHILGLYHQQPRARLWRRTLSTLPYEDGADENAILKALEAMKSENLAA